MIKHYTILIYAWLLGFLIRFIMVSKTTIVLRFIKGFNGFRNFNASAKAYSEFIKAKKRVPAYKNFLISKGFDKPNFTGIVPNIYEIPETDKAIYVKKYSIVERCLFGEIPSKKVIIDESSGSSGSATNWVRGEKERKMNTKMIQFGIQKLFGKDDLFIINAFAMGAWATGVNITMSCLAISKLKSIGPDKVKIENTIKNFGEKHQYVIMGYPPFLKTLVDNSTIDWKSHNVVFIFGGESMSEGMRDYLIGKGIKKIYSSYGASDLELNIASENDFTISIRKLLNSNIEFREKVLKYSGALPMIFQYNPTDFFIETNTNGELVITVCRPNYLAPKIRYNIHDKGHVLQLKQFYSILKDMNINTNEIINSKTDLPLLFHYGRSDMTVSFYGANISPTDVQEAIFNIDVLAKKIHSFYISTKEDAFNNKELSISMELNINEFIKTDQFDILEAIFYNQLSLVNQDFREAKKMLLSSKQLILSFFEYGKGPFENNDIRIKAKYCV